MFSLTKQLQKKNIQNLRENRLSSVRCSILLKIDACQKDGHFVNALRWRVCIFIGCCRWSVSCKILILQLPFCFFLGVEECSEISATLSFQKWLKIFTATVLFLFLNLLLLFLSIFQLSIFNCRYAFFMIGKSTYGGWFFLTGKICVCDICVTWNGSDFWAKSWENFFQLLSIALNLIIRQFLSREMPAMSPAAETNR